MDVIFAYIDNAIPVNIHTPSQMSKFVWGATLVSLLSRIGTSLYFHVQGWNISYLPCPGVDGTCMVCVGGTCLVSMTRVGTSWVISCHPPGHTTTCQP